MEGFFYYRLPNVQDIQGFSGCWNAVLELEVCHDGVIVSSFDKEKIYNMSHPQKENLSFLNQFQVDSLSSNFHIAESEYLTQVDQCKLFCEETQGKIVLSRIKKGYCRKSLKEMFLSVCAVYKSAFVSLTYIPEQGYWIGATPEKLLVGEAPVFKIDSLAGSRNILERFEWTNKEIEEQDMVTQCISSKLKKLNLSFKLSHLQTVKAGNVEHLFKEFIVTDCHYPLVLVNELHPTPAVSGLPIKQAMQNISLIEKHNRNLYAGIIGVNFNGKLNLFVNIRCGQIFKDCVDVYVGGGITKDSNALSEWKETEFKSQTLLSVFEKM